MNYLKEIRTTNLIIRLREDEIIETIHKDNWTQDETLDHAKENMAAIAKISEDKIYPTLNYLSDHRVTDEAQKYYAGHPPLAIASAMITKSMIQILLGNIFIRIRKLKIPTRLFKETDEAVEWLNEKRTEYFNNLRKEAV